MERAVASGANMKSILSKLAQQLLEVLDHSDDMLHVVAVAIRAWMVAFGDATMDMEVVVVVGNRHKVHENKDFLVFPELGN